MNKILVAHQLYVEGEIVNVPIQYEILVDQNRKVYKCVVDIPEEKVPEWLSLREFEIPIVQQNNVTVTLFSEVRGLKNIDSALFLHDVEMQISLRETWQGLH